MKKQLFLIASLGIACALYAEDSSPKCSGKPQDQTIIGAVKWYRDSAEQKALYREIYAVATRYIEDKVKSDNLKPGTWGVSIDIDETTLDNSWYFKNCTEVASQENDFSEFVVKPELSTALPGDNGFY